MISLVTFDPINFNVTSGLFGLQGLQGLVSISQPDVVGGTTDGINLNINSASSIYYWNMGRRCYPICSHDHQPVKLELGRR